MAPGFDFQRVPTAEEAEPARVGDARKGRRDRGKIDLEYFRARRGGDQASAAGRDREVRDGGSVETVGESFPAQTAVAASVDRPVRRGVEVARPTGSATSRTRRSGRRSPGTSARCGRRRRYEDAHARRAGVDDPGRERIGCEREGSRAEVPGLRVHVAPRSRLTKIEPPDG